ncbi:MAG: hypothetical protein KC619_09365 [Myxococcales bacterium]|nr:hypothetical protein [Myxococcales bacterium]
MLRLLHPDGRRLVTPELASGQIELWSREAYDALLRHAPHPVELAPMDAAIDRVIAEHPRFGAAIDGALAPALHRALPLSRRDAAEPGVWRFLTVVHRPDFVRHRWENRSWSTMRTRFWRPGTRPDSNALSRLWWIAELTRDGDDYSLTERVLSRQPLATALFVRDLSSHRPFTAAFVDAFETSQAQVIEVGARMINRRLSTTVVEGLGQDALRAMTEAERDRAEAQLADSE